VDWISVQPRRKDAERFRNMLAARHAVSTWLLSKFAIVERPQFWQWAPRRLQDSLCGGQPS
jgi:hypothetical protein